MFANEQEILVCFRCPRCRALAVFFLLIFGLSVAVVGGAVGAVVLLGIFACCSLLKVETVAVV